MNIIHVMANDDDWKKIILLQMTIIPWRALSFVNDHNIWTLLSPSGTSAVFWLVFNHSLERGNLNLQSLLGMLETMPQIKSCLMKSSVSWWYLVVPWHWQQCIMHFSLCRFHTAPKFKGLWFLGLWRSIAKLNNFFSPLSSTAWKDNAFEEL